MLLGSRNLVLHSFCLFFGRKYLIRSIKETCFPPYFSCLVSKNHSFVLLQQSFCSRIIVMPSLSLKMGQFYAIQSNCWKRIISNYDSFLFTSMKLQICTCMFSLRMKLNFTTAMHVQDLSTPCFMKRTHPFHRRSEGPL